MLGYSRYLEDSASGGANSYSCDKVVSGLFPGKLRVYVPSSASMRRLGLGRVVGREPEQDILLLWPRVPRSLSSVFKAKCLGPPAEVPKQL